VTTTATTTAAAVLEYGNPPARRRRRRVLWALVVLAVVASMVVATGVAIRRHIESRAAAARQQARAAMVAAQAAATAQQAAKVRADLDACRAYRAPADRVVCELDPARAKALLGANASGASTDGGYAAIYRDMGAEFTPTCWKAIGAYAIYPDGDTAGKWGISPAGIAFLHERTAPGGAPAIVRVQVGMISTAKPVLNPLVIRDVHGLGVAPRELGILLDPADDFRVFAGQPDGADASHFTIGYEINGKRGMIDGWLLPDDQIKLTPREGKVFERDDFPVWQPAGTKAQPASDAAANKFPR
jgi:hypothetical protein